VEVTVSIVVSVIVIIWLVAAAVFLTLHLMEISDGD
jgi:hypothetical protein